MITNNEHLIFYAIIIILILYCLMLLKKLQLKLEEQKKLIESETEKAKEKIAESEEMLMRFLVFVFLIISVVGAQEEVPILEDPGFAEPEPGAGIEIPIDPGPLVFPEEMPKAAEVIEQIVSPVIEQIFCPTCLAEEDAVQAKMAAFLANDTGNISINFTA